MFNRIYKEIPLDGGDNPPKKVTVTYTGDPCPETGPLSNKSKLDILRAVVDNPTLLDCGLSSFQTMTMKHNGQSWVMVLEAKTT
jgi:hypothetical protein